MLGRGGELRLLLLILLLFALRLCLYRGVAGGFPLLPVALCHWDCEWYIDVALNGYQAGPMMTPGPTFGQANWAFFPVYPGLVRTAIALFGLPAEQAAITVSNFFLCVFVFVSVKYLRAVNKDASGAALAVFLFAFPYTIYFSLPYTESTFAAITVMVFYLMSTQRLVAASLAAGVLSATRVTGVLITPILAIHYLRKILGAWSRGEAGQARIELRAAILPLALAPLGLFAFMLFLYAHVGDAFAFIHIQRGWGRPDRPPLDIFEDGLFAFDLGSIFAPKMQSATFAALCAAAGLLLCYRLLMQKRFSECWFLAMSILLPLSHGLASMPRYVLANPIFLIFSFEYIWTSKYRPYFKEIILASCLLQLYFLHFWIQSYAFLF
jgi:hypothetical protein